MGNKAAAIAALGGIIIAVCLAGCGGVQKDATYDDASKLRDAVVASGIDCPGNDVKHDSKFGEDYIKCSSGLALSVFDTDQELNIAKIPNDFSKTPYLSGKRWFIQGDTSTLKKVEDKLGGTLSVP